MSAFVKWPKVRQIHNLRKDIKAKRRFHEVENLPPYVAPTVGYRGKVKLDGTNAAVTVTPDSFTVQSRTRVITPEDDNMGFAAWVHSSGWMEQDWGTAIDRGLTVFGEWCGKGIQKRCAISKIDRKVFCVFAVCDCRGKMEVDPDKIRDLLPEHEDVYILPWDKSITINFESVDALTKAADTLNEMIAEYERCDPWVRATFGIEGLGEGIVFYPVVEVMKEEIPAKIDAERMASWAFKAKGEEHQVVRQKKPVILDVEKVASVEAFVDKFVTSNRLMQGVQEVCKDEDPDMSKTGAFMKWFGNDVRVESEDELEASGLTWKDVSKTVEKEARTWWLDLCRNS